MKANKDGRERYARQLALPEIGTRGQQTLLASKVAVIGLGGLGCPAATYLAAAGVGVLGIVDGDRVDSSNLQRQPLHSTGDVGREKAESAGEALQAINPEIQLRVHSDPLVQANATTIISEYDFVIDATDNFASKFLIADTCDACRIPYSHAGILRFAGQTMTVIPRETACYRCIFEEPDEICGPSIGPLGAVPAVIGAIQATEAVKLLVRCGELLTNRLLTYDALAMSFREVVVSRNPSCSLCAE